MKTSSTVFSLLVGERYILDGLEEYSIYSPTSYVVHVLASKKIDKNNMSEVQKERRKRSRPPMISFLFPPISNYHHVKTSLLSLSRLSLVVLLVIYAFFSSWCCCYPVMMVEGAFVAGGVVPTKSSLLHGGRRHVSLPPPISTTLSSEVTRRRRRSRQTQPPQQPRSLLLRGDNTMRYLASNDDDLIDNDENDNNDDTSSSSSSNSSSNTNSKIRDPKFVTRNKYWIIIVDDEEPIREAVGNFLYDSGYQVTACSDADALLEVCANTSNNSGGGEDDIQDDDNGDGILPKVPDAIISDVRMPGKDGIELLGLIRADERLERVPVILLTAKALTQDRILGYKAGADVYLPKPFDPDELLSIVDNAIQRRKQMSGKSGTLSELKDDMATIKQLMRKNSSKVVKKTDVYLTDTERDVLEYICKGYTNGEIAQERNVSVIGVNRMIQKLYLTTGTSTRTELVRWAISTGYVSRRR